MESIDHSLALPMLGMLSLTLLVWIYMFVQRVGYMTANAIDIEDVRSPDQVAAQIPPESSSASHNFKNMFELPVLFYVVCLYLMVLGQVDSIHVTCAWVFVALRALHSLIHCSYNRVLHRFLAYLIASLALWAMVIRAVLAAM